MNYVRAALLVAASLFLAHPACAVPPPPPASDTLHAVQAMIRALKEKDLAGYQALLAEDFVARKSEDGPIISREDWLDDMGQAFSNEVLSITILHVYEGSAIVEGAFRPQVMLVEHVSNYALRDGIPGDCCGFYLTETLTLAGAKIKRIERSTLFDNELSQAGARTDLR